MEESEFRRRFREELPSWLRLVPGAAIENFLDRFLDRFDGGALSNRDLQRARSELLEFLEERGHLSEGKFGEDVTDAIGRSVSPDWRDETMSGHGSQGKRKPFYYRMFPVPEIVREKRRELFDDPKPPFPDDPDGAYKWLAGHDGFLELRAAVVDGEEERVITIEEPGSGENHSFYVRTDTEVDKFRSFVKSAKRWYGISETDSFLFFLTGSWYERTSKSTGPMLFNKDDPDRVTAFCFGVLSALVRKGDLTGEHYDRLEREADRILRTREVEALLNDKERLLKHIVEMEGGFPEKGAGRRDEFWARVTEIYNEESWEDRVSESTLRTRWSRLNDKLGRD